MCVQVVSKDVHTYFKRQTFQNVILDFQYNICHYTDVSCSPAGRVFAVNLPVVLSGYLVAELVYDVLVQGGGGGVRTGPAELPASITRVVCGQTDRWPGSHCTTQQQIAVISVVLTQQSRGEL